MFDGFLNSIFGGLISEFPLFTLILLSFLLTLFVTLIYKWMTDQEMMKSLREDLKKYQGEMKSLSSEPEKMMSVQKKALDANMKYMMHSFKPMLITFIPLIIIFGWLRSSYQTTDLNFLGIFHNWIWVYIISSVLFSLAIRKVLKIH